jgi:DNA-directed RNA polymerase specialized sigma24 family protein
VRRELELLRAGKLPFAEFVRRTAPHWDRMAAALMRRWRVPAGVERADVVQELLLAAWRLVPEWDPARGPTLHHYVAWNASIRAKKWLHKQRGAKRWDDAAPSRHARAFTELDPDGLDPGRWDRLLQAGYDAELEAAEQEEVLRALGRLERPEEADLLLLLFDCAGDLDAAAERLCREPAARLAYRVGDVGAARRVLRRVAMVAASAAA